MVAARTAATSAQRAGATPLPSGTVTPAATPAALVEDSAIAGSYRDTPRCGTVPLAFQN